MRNRPRRTDYITPNCHQFVSAAIDIINQSMSLEEQKLLYGHIIRILTYLDEGGEDDRP